ncbi:hypothetical protein OS242_09560 [Tumebacillus sp. DT12]|uniref:Lipoprotein n=1 Tax=Tumebacillus lacus TaxID=2995335 RepID=A0ABT3X2L9_9BACL|nr:hypothetical protein [Tumebacillus lacus]MCX7570207.1 hypothetical protein [Tumebacillus lacus]
MNRFKTSIAATTVFAVFLSGCSSDALVKFADELPVSANQQVETADQSPTGILYQQVFEQLQNGDLTGIELLLDEILRTAGDSPDTYRAQVLLSMVYTARAEAYFSMTEYLDKGFKKVPPTEEEVNSIREMYSLIKGLYESEQPLLAESVRYVLDHEDSEAVFPFIFQEKTPITARLLFQGFANGEQRIPDATTFETFILQETDEMFSGVVGKSFDKKKLNMAEFLFRIQYSLRPEHNDLAIEMLNQVLELEACDPYSFMRVGATNRLADLKERQSKADSF